MVVLIVEGVSSCFCSRGFRSSAIGWRLLRSDYEWCPENVVLGWLQVNLRGRRDAVEGRKQWFECAFSGNETFRRSGTIKVVKSA